MNRQHVYKHLANNAFEHAAVEENAQLLAQWKILGARWLELAAQPENTTEKAPLDDPIPWDHETDHRFHVKLQTNLQIGPLPYYPLRWNSVPRLKQISDKRGSH